MSPLSNHHFIPVRRLCHQSASSCHCQLHLFWSLFDNHIFCKILDASRVPDLVPPPSLNLSLTPRIISVLSGSDYQKKRDVSIPSMPFLGAHSMSVDGLLLTLLLERRFPELPSPSTASIFLSVYLFCKSAASLRIQSPEPPPFPPL